MKNVLILGFAMLSLSACKSKKTAINADTLPKDISQKPDNVMLQQEDQQKMSVLIKEIDALIAAETCSDVADWKFTAIGSKPCGGPSSYIAYPIKLEDEILAKVSQFTSMQSAFNTNYGLMSDCAMVLPPAEIRCENGKAVLIGDRSENQEPRIKN